MNIPEIQRIIGELESALGQVSPDAAEGMIDRINAHERIFCFAAGRSGLMLRAFAMRLIQMGKTVWVVGETVTPAIGPGDLLILASASGETKSVLLYAEEAMKAGADLLVITARAGSSLCKMRPADICLPTPTKDEAAGEQAMGSLFEQALLLHHSLNTRTLSEQPKLHHLEELLGLLRECAKAIFENM